MCELPCSFRTQTTNNNLSTISSPVTVSWHSGSGSTQAPLVNTPASPPSQPVSLPDNNSLNLTTFIAIFPSRFKWWEHKHDRNIWSSLFSFKFNAFSGILELQYSLLCLQSSGTLVVASFISTHSSFGGPWLSLLSLPRPPQTCLWWLGGLVVAWLDLSPPHFQTSTKFLRWFLAMLQSRISLFLKLQQDYQTIFELKKSNLKHFWSENWWYQLLTNGSSKQQASSPGKKTSQPFEWFFATPSPLTGKI